MKKKILIIVNHEIVIYNFRKELVETLIDKDYQVSILCPPGKKLEYFSDLGCELIEYDIERHGKNPINEYKIYKIYLDAIKKVRPEMVLTYTIKPNIYGGVASKKMKVPFIANVTGIGNSLQKKNLLSNGIKQIYRFVLKSAKTVFFQNDANLRTIYGESENHNGLLLPGSGVNTEHFSLQEYPENETLTITYMGRLMKSKGIIELIEAFFICDDLNIQLNLVGFIDDDIDQIIKDSVRKSEGRISYEGFTNDPIKIYNNSDVIINPSHHEGMSNLLLEGGACGRPLLASNIPGCKEIIINNKNGYLFEPKSSVSISESIRKFYKMNLESRIDFGMKSRELVENKFNRNIVIDKYLESIGSKI